MKGHIKSNANVFKLTEAEQPSSNGFEVVTAEYWKILIKHERGKVEDHSGLVMACMSSTSKDS